MSNAKNRNWCGTKNNYEQGWIDAMLARPEFKYIIVGKEVAPTTGTPHAQFFMMFKNAVRFATVSDICGAGCHLEACKGSAEQNIAYCEKEGDFQEGGVRPLTSKQKGEKEKRRYEEAWDHAVNGELADIDADIRVRHYSTLKRIRMDKVAERELVDTEETMEWYWGPSGTGKSRKARTENPSAYLKMCNKWWDSYVDQDVVLIEDFDVKHAVLVHHLKIWADRYPYLAEIKGGSVKIRPKKIIVTSNYHPSSIWTDPSDLEPILRRFHVTQFHLMPGNN
jgi:hypothetical protein